MCDRFSREEVFLLPPPPSVSSPKKSHPEYDDIILKYFMTNVKEMTECNSHEKYNIYPNFNAISFSALQ